MKRYILYLIIVILSVNMVLSVDVWDRPNQMQNVTINITNNYYYNQTYNDSLLWDALNNLSLQIAFVSGNLDDEINGRIGNETYIYNLISGNTYSINILFNLSYNETLQREENDSLLLELMKNETYDNDTQYLNQTEGDALYYPLATNPAGYINMSIANSSFYPLLDNPAGYINNTLEGFPPYLYNDSIYMYFNETLLNHTINNISKIRKYVMNISCNVVSGVCYNVSNQNVSYLITEIKVIPQTLTNKYRFQAEEYPSGNIIDRDRTRHTGIWDIEKNYAINSQISINFTDVQIDEEIIAQIIYLNNGIE